ncbi:MAG: AAC(3) family N-acetyltransferase [Candidatus Latescibacterota bacterium]|nr:AAC(3) family N-acetyltransferase [Candidatus Latescibacterota bacterium]
MTAKAIPSLTRYLKSEGSVLSNAISGPRILRDIRSIFETDRWNSFDRFHDTTSFLLDAYEQAGVESEVYRIRTGGEPGTGRWIIREASDIRSATVDIVSPVKSRVLDYVKNPWHVIQWSASTPRGGLRSDLIVIDTEEELIRAGRTLKGKTVLTRMDARTLVGKLSAAGVLAVITDRGIAGLPNATAWTKFGWGAIPLENAGARLVGLVLSQREGSRLRKLYGRHNGNLVLHIEVDVRPYVGDHDLVSGIVKGAHAPDEELWVLAHSAEPGAIDNASGIAVCLETARAMEKAIKTGKMARPKRSIRFLSGFECYSFFNYMEFVRRYQTPMAGLCVDTVGAKPEVCEGQLSWRATIPMSATFVDSIGHATTRSAIRRIRPGYRLVPGGFVSTSDTLAGDPKYGFPCPWITTHYRKDGSTWNAYHSSADTPSLLSPAGLATATLSTATYLAYLAGAGNRELIEIAKSETESAIAKLRRQKDGNHADYVRQQHYISIERLKRWMWGGSRNEILSQLGKMESSVRRAGPVARRAGARDRSFAHIPRRKRPITPTPENTRSDIAARIRKTGLPQWAVYWADGERSIAQITRLVSQEVGQTVAPEAVSNYFEAHTDLGYTEIIDATDVISKKMLVEDLKELGVVSGMIVMVHSSLSSVGHVTGSAETVVDALLSAVGRSGTLVMPSFNHGGTSVYNPMTSRVTSGAIPDAFWRRAGVERSNHPSHAVAAHGPRARDLTTGHVEGGIWTEHDPIARLIRAGGYILSLGVTHTSSTAYHIGELSVPCGCIDPFGSLGRIVDEDGSIRTVDTLAWRGGSCPVDPAKLNVTLSKNPKQKAGKVGRANATLVPARLIYDARRRHLRTVCPTCNIKPKANR